MARIRGTTAAAVQRDREGTALAAARTLSARSADPDHQPIVALKGADTVVTFDSDGQHQAEDVAAMLQTLDAGDCDVVLGSRFLGKTVGMPASRRLLLKLAVRFSNLGSRDKLTDAHNGLRVMSRKAAQALHISQHGMAHASEIIHQFRVAKLRIKEHPVTIHYTDYSVSKGQRSLNAINILLEVNILE